MPLTATAVMARIARPRCAPNALPEISRRGTSIRGRDPGSPRELPFYCLRRASQPSLL